MYGALGRSVDKTVDRQDSNSRSVSPCASWTGHKPVTQVDLLDMVLEVMRLPDVSKPAVDVCVELLEKLRPHTLSSLEFLEAATIEAALNHHVAIAEKTPGGSDLDRVLQCQLAGLGTSKRRERRKATAVDDKLSTDQAVPSPYHPGAIETSLRSIDTMASPSRAKTSDFSVVPESVPSSRTIGPRTHVIEDRWSWSQMPWLPDEPVPARKLHLLFEEGKSKIGKCIVCFVTLTLVLSVVAFVMESMPDFRERPARCDQLRREGLPLTVQDCEPRPKKVFHDIETFCIVVFTLDYLTRLFTAHAMKSVESERSILDDIRRTLRYALQPINVVDLLAILPYYIDLLSGSDKGGALDILRLARICRVFKMARHHPGVRMFAEVMQRSGQPFLILVLFNAIICLLFASLMYIAEGQKYSVAPEYIGGNWSIEQKLDDEPRPFPTGVFVRNMWRSSDYEPTPFRSIPVAIWWVCVTLTTVGYGDMAPTTPLGRIIGVAAFYVGILFLALPISILGSNFEAVYKKVTESRDTKRKEADKSSLPPTSQTADLSRFMSTAPRDLTWSAMAWTLYRDPRVRQSRAPARKTLFILLEQPSSCKASKIYSVFIIFVILMVTLTLVFESMPEFLETPPECNLSAPTEDDCKPKPKAIFHALEVVGIMVFTVDYIGRLATVHTADFDECGLPQTAQGYSGLRRTWLYFIQWMNIIDLLAILPFYMQAAIGLEGGGMAAVRVLRLTRVFRVLRMKKLSSGVNMFVSVMDDSLPALSLLFFMTLLACLFFASCISFAEGSSYTVDGEWLQEFPYGLYVRPTVDGYGTMPSPFSSILYSFWWFFVTATTVGYGDDYPTTSTGRFIGLLVVYIGIILLALPISVIGSSFAQRYVAWEKEICSEIGGIKPQSLRRAESNVTDDMKSKHSSQSPKHGSQSPKRALSMPATPPATS